MGTARDDNTCTPRLFPRNPARCASQRRCKPNPRNPRHGSSKKWLSHTGAARLCAMAAACYLSDVTNPSMNNSDAPLLGDIAPEEFRRHAKRVLQWIGDYLERPERYPVVPRVVPGEIAGTIPTEPPLEPES